MKRLTRIYILISLLCLPLWAQAQNEYVYELTSNKKTIHMDQLGLPGTMNLYELIRTMPELLGRNISNLLDNFTVQLDGKSLLSSEDVLLEQLLLSDIDVIEISTSPVASQQKKGISGSINIKLKPLEEGFHGSARFTGSTEWDAMPSVSLNYHKNKFEMRTILAFEYYGPKTYTTNLEETDSIYTITQDTIRERWMQQTVSAVFKYKPTTRDELSAWVWESMKWTREQNASGTNCIFVLNPFPYLSSGASDVFQTGQWTFFCPGSMTGVSRNSEIKTGANIEYEHKYRRGGSFDIEATYNYNPTTTFESNKYKGYYYMATPDYEQDDRLKTHSIDFQVKSEHELLNPDGPRSLKFRYGMAASATIKEFSNSEEILASQDSCASGTNRSLLLNPYLKFNFKGTKVQATLTTNYEYFTRAINLNGHDTIATQHNFTGDLNLLWQVVDHHALQGILSRSVQRPRDTQLSPYMVLNRQTRSYSIGNLNLEPVYFHSANLNYIFDYQKDIHSIVLNAGLGYIRTDGMIEQVTKMDKVMKRPFTTYENRGISNIACANAMLYYKVKFFTMHFSGNFYYNATRSGETTDRFHYFNLSFSPIFSLPRQWTLSGQVLYNSAIHRLNGYTGDCIRASIRVNKIYKNWNFYADVEDIFDYQSTDVTYLNPASTWQKKPAIQEHIYDQYIRCLMVGFTYNF